MCFCGLSRTRGSSPPWLNRKLHAIDATPARWRGGVGLASLDLFIKIALFRVPDSLFDLRTGKQVALEDNEIRMLCIRAREVFMAQPILLELEAPIKICGDLCGNQPKCRVHPTILH